MIMSSVCDAVHCDGMILPTAEVYEQVNRKCSPENDFTAVNSPH